MNYLLESTVCITIFYGLYYLIFRRLTFIRLNRIYLLSSLVIGLSLPLVSYEITEVVKIPANVEYEETSSMPLVINSSTPLISNTPLEEPFDWKMILQGIYLLGIILMTLKLLYSFKNIFKLIIEIKSKKSVNPTNPNSDGVASDGVVASDNFYISTQSNYANSSFFNLIFIDDSNLSEQEINQILEHEKWHIRLYHSYDLLFVEILKIIFWFNPILWLYQRSLSEVHEYEVDTRMIQTYNPQTYAQLLLKLATTPQLAATHQFSRKPLTDRIHFLFTKQKSVPMKRLAYLSVLPILGAFFMAFSVEKVVDYQEVEESSKYFKIVRGEKISIKESNMSKLAVLRLKKDEIELMIGFDKLSKESIIDAMSYFKKYGFSLDIVDYKLDNINQLTNIRLSLLEDNREQKPKNRDILYGLYNDGLKLDLKEFKISSKNDKGLCLLIRADKKTGEHSVTFANIPPTPPNPPKAPPAPPKPPLPPIKVGLEKKDKVGEVIINNERFFYSVNRRDTTLYDRFGVQVSEEEKAFGLGKYSSLKRDSIKLIGEGALGKNPLVIINGKKYPSDVLYKLNLNKIFGTTLYRKNNPKPIIKELGENNIDGAVVLETREENELFLTGKELEISIENETKRQNIKSKKLAVSRVTLTGQDGKKYDEVTVYREDGSKRASVNVREGGKVLFLVKGAPKTEEELKKINPKTLGNSVWASDGRNEYYVNKFPKIGKNTLATIAFND